MIKISSLFRSDAWASAIVLLLASAAVYLPFLAKIGASNDDWYLLYAARAGGPGIFQAIFSVDRPMRAFVLGPTYALFGQHVPLYNLSAWIFRAASALFLL